MATYLQLCQSVLTYTNTEYGHSLIGVDALTLQLEQRLAVDFVRLAWTGIQTDQEWWGWMRREFKFTPILNKNVYSWNQMEYDEYARNPEARPQGGSGGGLQIADDPEDSIPSAGGFRTWLVSSEVPWRIGDTGNVFAQITYDEWKALSESSNAGSGTPVYFAIAPDLKLCLHPTPSENAHRARISGSYQIAPQILANDNDVPFGLPPEYHDAIAFRAVNLIGSQNQDMQLVEWATRMENDIMADVRRLYLPQIKLGSAYS